MFEALKADILSKKLKPIYFLSGDEDYFIDSLIDMIEHKILDESEKEFNQTVLYGRDINTDQVLENAKRFPMMSDRQVVIVKEAQNIKSIENLSDYCKNPLPSTILAIAYKGKSVDGRTKKGKEFLEAVKKNGVHFESKKLYDDKIPDWISEFVRMKGKKITPKAAFLLSEYLGNDLSKIVNEVDKLLINMASLQEVTEKLIEDYVGISKDYNNFELQKCIAQRNAEKCFQIATYFSKNSKDHPIIVTISTLFGFFSKILVIHLSKNKSKDHLAVILKVRPFFMNDYMLGARNYDARKTVEIISILREYDLKSKGVDSTSSNDGELIKEMIYKILA